MKVYKYCIILGLLFIVTNSYAQVAVIANKSVPENSISVSKLGEIYNLKTKKWSNGSAIAAFTLKTDNDASNKFFSTMGKSSIEMKKIWMKLQLTGEGQAPVNCDSEEQIVEKVGSTSGGIGFVSASKVTDKVKVLVELK